MQIPYYVDLLGTMVFAISGALAAFGKKLYQDIFGVSFTAFVTAIGGGTLRDIFLDLHPLAWIKDGNYIIAIITGVMLTVFFRRYIKKIPRTLLHHTRGSKSIGSRGKPDRRDHPRNGIRCFWWGIT